MTVKVLDRPKLNGDLLMIVRYLDGAKLLDTIIPVELAIGMLYFIVTIIFVSRMRSSRDPASAEWRAIPFFPIWPGEMIATITLLFRPKPIDIPLRMLNLASRFLFILYFIILLPMFYLALYIIYPTT